MAEAIRGPLHRQGYAHRGRGLRRPHFLEPIPSCPTSERSHDVHSGRASECRLPRTGACLVSAGLGCPRGRHSDGINGGDAARAGQRGPESAHVRLLQHEGSPDADAGNAANRSSAAGSNGGVGLGAERGGHFRAGSEHSYAEDPRDRHPHGPGFDHRLGNGADWPLRRWRLTIGSSCRVGRNVGAWILGRNMFGPIRGSWPDMNWKGWWGDNPPYHVPTFILTHHARPPIQMEGDTTFHFITGGIREALDRAREAAAGMDVRIGGGPDTIQQYLREGLIDELHIAIAPVLLGRGEPLLEGVDLLALGYECVEFVASEKATHIVLRRQGHTDA